MSDEQNTTEVPMDGPKVEAQTRIEPSTNALVETISQMRDWKRAHTLRRAIEIGIQHLADEAKAA